MEIDQMLSEIPLWLMYVLTVLIVLLSVVCGRRMGSRKRLQRKGVKDAPIGSIVAALLGLLGFLLVFTFGMAGTRFDSRKQLLLDEVNAIGTASLRTDFLPEPQRTASRALLNDYVALREEAALNPAKPPQAMADSEAFHDRLWSQVASLPKEESNSILLGLYIQSLNEVIDLHAKRVTVGLQYRIPATIWLMLYFVAILAMAAVGYQFGFSNTSSWLSVVLLALAFSAVILLIADLERTQEGLLRLTHKPMTELHQKLSRSVP